MSIRQAINFVEQHPLLFSAATIVGPTIAGAIIGHYKLEDIVYTARSLPFSCPSNVDREALGALIGAYSGFITFCSAFLLRNVGDEIKSRIYR